MRNYFTYALLTALFVLPFANVTKADAAVIPQWNTTGSYVIAFNYLGTDYAHDMTLAQDGVGGLTGNGGNPAGGPLVYTWVLTSGTVAGNVIDFTANYTATPDAVTPQTTMHVVGTIATSGEMTGTWSDNYQGGARTGTWKSTTGAAVALGSLAAEDFGVVNYDTGLGMLKGYSAGFGLTDATFLGVQSVVVQLFSSSTLLQTNTATAKVGTDITGAQISSPFDVTGTFDYTTDGYWTNVRAAEYGQSVPATRVVATVTLANGKIVTATNLVVTGDPATIFATTTGTTTPPVATSTPPTVKSQCMNNGWATFTNPSFANQGQCVEYVEHTTKTHDGDDNHHGHDGHDIKNHEKGDKNEKDDNGGSRGHGRRN